MATPTCILTRIEDEVQMRLNSLKEPKWLPLSYGQEILKNEDIRSAVEKIPRPAHCDTDLSRLVEFAQNKARQVFVMLISMGIGGVLYEFHRNGLGDDAFPLCYDLQKLERTGAEVQHDNRLIQLRFSPLTSRRDVNDLFGMYQFCFFPLRLQWRTIHDPPIDLKQRLPFLDTFEETTPKSTNFSDVYKLRVHHHHIAMAGSSIVSSLDLAES